jgi:transposase
VIGDGLSISQVAEKVGVSRQTLHAWLAQIVTKRLVSDWIDSQSFSMNKRWVETCILTGQCR